MTNPNFIKLAEAYSIPAEKVEKRERLRDAVQKMLDAQGPYFMEAIVETEENVFPMVPAGASVTDIRLE